MDIGNQEVLEKLDGIANRLDVIIHLLLAPIEKSEAEITGKSQKEILKLCNFKNTRADIAKKTGKSLNSVDVTINKLKNRGLINSVKVEDKIYYVRLK